MPTVIDARTASDHFPGIGRYVVNLCRALGRVAPDLDLVVLHDPSATTSRLTLPNVPRLACPTSPFALRQQWLVPRQLRRAGARLYHSPYYLMPYWPGVPTVLTCHDVIPLVYPGYFSAWQRLVFRLAHWLALRAVRHVIAVSQSTRADLRRFFGLPAPRVTVIPEAADPRYTPRPVHEIAALRQRYGLPPGYVLYLGSNKPHKNLVHLVQAWAFVSQRGVAREVQLVIAGPWDARYPESQHLAEQLGLETAIRFLGTVPEADLPALYSGAVLLVFPSLYEGFGLPVLEAMACGTPVACANTSSLPEVVGDAAPCFDPNDLGALADLLVRLLTDVDWRAALREAGLRRAACFSWEETARQTLAVYTAVQSGALLG